ncbi:MAG: 16S rRNA (cytosine(967)-C(5))-methyltransferase RsmB [Candidatus Accumulibacter sp.]|jgi:16S rRNA (cytosine967-C5)-methyltransferase|nr:16S rRNA (cytosine(967)-C(5))-methyltransferase RsmB [Accumulibacter sp.]
MKPDSLGESLLQAARVLVCVDAGRSLSEALGLLVNESPRARAAASDIVYGVLRRFGESEFILGKLLSRPLAHPETNALLQSALYRLETRRDSTPMVVDQAVSAAGELADGRYKALVNAVLRNYLRRRETLLAESLKDETVRFMHPAWWLKRLRKTYPGQWEAIVDAGNSAPPMTLRVNLRKITQADYAMKLESSGLKAESIGSQALLLETPLPVNRLPGFDKGLVSIQDAGAQQAASLLAPEAGMRVLDACAAPGGKATHLLELTGIDLLALDIDETRAKKIAENLERAGFSAEIGVADCCAIESWWDGRPFDAILADVPCSGSGVVRRHPDIKKLRRESDIRKFAEKQREILEALWQVLGPGGKFLYATCSVFTEENTGQIDAFMVRHPEAERVLDRQLLPGRKHDGFYYALLRKTL